MSADINLLPQRKGNILRSERTLLRFKLFAAGCVFLLLFCEITIFLMNKANDPVALKAQSDQLVAKLSQSKPKALEQLALIDRLGHIQTILNNRTALQSTISLIQKQIPQAATINTFTLDSRSLSFSITTADLSTLDQVVNNMTSLVHNHKVIKKLTIDNAAANQASGQYVLSVDAKL